MRADILVTVAVTLVRCAVLRDHRCGAAATLLVLQLPCLCGVFAQIFSPELRLPATNVAVINAFARLDQRVELYEPARLKL